MQTQAVTAVPPSSPTVHVEWGLEAAQRLAPTVDVAVVVDVLSFTTTLSVALDRGIEVLPYRWADESAAGAARERDAVLAVGRSQARPGQVSLSPQTLRTAGLQVKRVLLPSPNGATIAHEVSGKGPRVLAACLRNAGAVAGWLTQRYGPDGVRFLVLAAGEHWPGGQLRPAVEDFWGAGAVVSGLRRRGWRGLSVEATAAADGYGAVHADVPGALHECVSGRELAAMGFSGDVDVAAEVEESVVVPELVGPAFRDAR